MKKKRENTVFILGAGASVPYGFPTSRSLRKDIIDNFGSKLSSLLPRENRKHDPYILHKLEEAGKFQERFDRSSILSVDYFLSRNPHFKEMGKDAIIIHLLE